MTNTEFTRILDAVHCSQLVNLIGIIVETSIPKKTKGTDFFCSAKIIDQSPSTGVYIHFFSETMAGLPRFRFFGDILVVTSVEMKSHYTGSYALFGKKRSSFALFYGKGSLVPYDISSRYKPIVQHKKSILEMRKWFTPDKSQDFDTSLYFREIKGGCCNLLCKIVRISQVAIDEWMLFIWDGTDAPSVPIEAKFEDEMKHPLPLQLEPSPLSRDILCTFPTVGTVLRMAVDRDIDERGIQSLKTNSWVMFVKVDCEIRSGLWCARLRPSSRFFYLSEDDKSVMRRKSDHDERVMAKYERMPFTSFPWPSPQLTVTTGNPRAPFRTLMDVLTRKKVPRKFKCVVRVVAIFPWRAEDFHLCGSYFVRLTLEDPTARIRAYVCGENWDLFFKDCQTVEKLTEMRNKLLGVGNEDSGSTVARNPPWIECGVLSYCTNPNDVLGSKKYYIIDTVAVP